MIHYILLPAEERHRLRREYRMRLAIVVFLFVSFILALGIASLFPSFFYSVNLEKDALAHKQALITSRKQSGAEKVESDLVLNQVTAQKISAEQNQVPFIDVIQRVLSHRKPDITIFSFAFDRNTTSTTTVGKLILTGKAATREGLLAFKKVIAEDKMFTDLALPLSDLQKSRNLDYTLTFTVKKQ